MEEDDNDIELSPGFFDVHHTNDNNEEYEEDVNNLIPERISLESPAAEKNNNVLVDLFVLVFTTSKTSCGCSGQEKGWARTATY